MDHVVGGSEIQPDAAGAQRDQEDVALAGLKGVDTLGSRLRRRAAIEVLIVDSLALQVGLHQPQVFDELREHQHLVAVFQQLLQGGSKGR